MSLQELLCDLFSCRAGGRPQDKDNYATFIEEMRQAFESESQKTGKERLLISMAVPASLEYAGQGYAIDRLDGALDFFNLLTYDYHSAHEPAVNHHSPLYRCVIADDCCEIGRQLTLSFQTGRVVRLRLPKGSEHRHYSEILCVPWSKSTQACAWNPNIWTKLHSRQP